MVVDSLVLHDWNEHPATLKLKEALKKEMEGLEQSVLGGDCTNNNAAYVACISEYRVIKSIIEDSLFKLGVDEHEIN